MGVIKRGEESSSQEIFVVNGARLALLGRPAIETLKIVQTVNTVEAEEVKEKFPNLFKGLAKLDGPDYVIKLKPDAKPHAISTPRRVAVPLLYKVKEELSRIEQMEMITRASVNGKPESENATVFLAKRGVIVPGVSCADCGNWG